MKMKLVSLLFFSATLVLSLVLTPPGSLIVPLVFGVLFAIYGLVRSVASHLDPLNDLPNALRVFLASMGGSLTVLTSVFIFPSAGILLLGCALFLNDEFQRRAFDAVKTRRRGGSIAFLGIDGSGKSSHSTVTGAWLRKNGYPSSVMPFHRYLFVERLSTILSSVGGRRQRRRGQGNSGGGGGGGGRTIPAMFAAGKRRGNPVRPLLSLLDNLLLQITTSLGCRLEGRVVIYDRFIWSTYIKYKALGYPVSALSSLYLLPRPTFALVLYVPVVKSLRVIDERVSHIHYPEEMLQAESDEYLVIARRRGYPVIDATASFEEVQEKIESYLSPLFPPFARIGTSTSTGSTRS